MQALNEGIFSAIWAMTGKIFLLDSLAILVARYLGYGVIIMTLLILLRSVDWRMRVFNIGRLLFAILIIRGIINSFIKYFYSSPRPQEVLGIEPLARVSGNSFPADTMVTLFIFSTAAFLANKKWGTIFYATSLFIGLTQIFVGIHWPLDILGGIFIGVLGMLIVHTFTLKFKRKIEYIPPEVFEDAIPAGT